ATCARMLSLNEIINISVTVIGLPLSVGPLFGLLIRDKWETNNRLLAGLCITAGLCALVPLLFVVSTWVTIRFLRLTVTIMMLVSGMFFLFTVDVLKANDRVAALSRTMLPAVVVFTSGAAWFTNIAQPTGDGFSPVITTYLLIA